MHVLNSQTYLYHSDNLYIISMFLRNIVPGFCNMKLWYCGSDEEGESDDLCEEKARDE